MLGSIHYLETAFGADSDVQWLDTWELFNDLNLSLELRRTERNVFLAETVQRIANKELTFAHMLKKEKTSFVLVALDVAFVPLFVLVEY